MSKLNIRLKTTAPDELYPKLNDPQDVLAAARKGRERSQVGTDAPKLISMSQQKGV